MRGMRAVFVSGLVLSCLVAAGRVTPVFANHQEAALIERALSGALPDLAKNVSIPDQEANRLQGGESEWSHILPSAHLQEIPPMCNASVRMEWADADSGLEDHTGTTIGICYMLASEEGPCKIEPCDDGRSRSWGQGETASGSKAHIREE